MSRPAPKAPLVNRIYRHYKGDYYIVRGLTRHSETSEPLVIYQALYGDGQLWARPLELFLDTLDPAKYPNASQRHRFELQEIPSHRQE